MKQIRALALVLLLTSTIIPSLTSAATATADMGAKTKQEIKAEAKTAEQIANIDVTLTDVVGSLGQWMRDNLKKISYYRSSMDFTAPTELTKLLKTQGFAGAMAAGWAVEFDWGFAGSGSLLDGSFPRFRLNIINKEDPNRGRLAGAALELIGGRRDDQALEDKLVGQLEGRDTGEGDDILSQVMKNLSDEDHPWLQYFFAVFRLVKHGWDTGLIKKSMFKRGDHSIEKQSTLWVVWEFARLNFRLFWSLKDKVDDPALMFNSLPSWSKELLSELSTLVGRESNYIQDMLNETWYGVWRYYKATYDDAGNVQNIGPAVSGFRVASAKDAKTIAAGIEKMKGSMGDYTFNDFAPVAVKALARSSKHSKMKKSLDKVAQDLEAGMNFQSFGLVDEKSPRTLVPAEIVTEVKQHLQHLPVVTSATVKRGKASEHWVFIISPRLNFAETTKLVSAIGLHAAFDFLRAWERAIGSGGALHDEYSKEIKPEILRIKERERQNEEFLQSSTAPLKDQAELSYRNVEEAIKKLTSVDQEQLDDAAKPWAEDITQIAQVGATAEEQYKKISAQLETVEESYEGVKKRRDDMQFVVTTLRQLISFAKDNKLPVVAGTDKLEAFLADDLPIAAKRIRGALLNKTADSVGEKGPAIAELISRLASDTGLDQFGNLDSYQQDRVVDKLRQIEEMSRNEGTRLAAELRRQQPRYDSLRKRQAELKKEIEKKPGRWEKMKGWVSGKKKSLRERKAQKATERWVFSGTNAMVAAQLMSQEFEGHEKTIETTKSKLKKLQISTSAGEDVRIKLESLEVQRDELLKLMKRKAIAMARNLSVTLQEKRQIYTGESIRLQGFTGVDKEQQDLVNARITYLTWQAATITTKLGEIERRRASVDIGVQDETAIMALANFVQVTIGYQSMLEDEESRMARISNKIYNFFTSARAKVPEFGRIRSRVINRLVAVAANSIAFRKYTNSYLIAIKLLLGPILDIKESDLKRIAKASG